MPDEVVPPLRAAAKLASYGWGVVPVEARLAKTVFTTSLFPRDGGYLVPLKDAVRKAAGVTAGDVVRLTLTVRPRS